MENKDKKSGVPEAIAIIVILLFLWWKTRKKGTKQEVIYMVKQSDIPDYGSDEGPLTNEEVEKQFEGRTIEECCENVVYRPLALNDLQGANLLGKKWCYRGDKSIVDESKGFGDEYAIVQGKEYADMKQKEANRINSKSCIQFILKNDGATKITTNLLNITQDVTNFATNSGEIVIRTTKTGIFTIGLAGIGDIIIDWGDGYVESINLASSVSYKNINHNYTSGGEFTISNCNVITRLSAVLMNVTEATIPKKCTKIEYLRLSSNQLTSFIAYPEWVNLIDIALNSNQLTSFIAYPEWVNLIYINLNSNQLTSFIAYPEWINLGTISLGENQLTSFIAYSEWINLTYLSLQDNQLTSFTAYPEWVKLTSLYLGTNQLTSFTTYSEWVELDSFYLNNNQLTSFIAYPEWINLAQLNLSTNQLTSFTAYPEWVELTSLYLDNNQLISFVAYPGWVNLIQLNLSTNQLTSFTAYKEWINIVFFSISDNQLTSFTAYSEWIKLQTIGLQKNQLTSFIAYKEWVNIIYINISENQLTSFIAHIEWIKLVALYLGNNQLTSFVVYSEWAELVNLYLSICALTESEVNAMLIELDLGPFTSSHIRLDGGTNAPPTGAGLTAKSSLISKGNTVLTN